MISGLGEIGLAGESVKLGAVDFLEKPYSQDSLEHALAEAFAGLDEAERKSRQLQSARRLDILSPREREVFGGGVGGKTNKGIALACKLSPRTVESYRLQMMSKLGVRNLHDLLALSASARRGFTEARRATP